MEGEGHGEGNGTEGEGHVEGDGTEGEGQHHSLFFGSGDFIGLECFNNEETKISSPSVIRGYAEVLVQSSKQGEATRPMQKESEDRVMPKGRGRPKGRTKNAKRQEKTKRVSTRRTAAMREGIQEKNQPRHVQKSRRVHSKKNKGSTVDLDVIISKYDVEDVIREFCRRDSSNLQKILNFVPDLCTEMGSLSHLLDVAFVCYLPLKIFSFFGQFLDFFGEILHALSVFVGLGGCVQQLIFGGTLFFLGKHLPFVSFLLQHCSLQFFELIFCLFELGMERIDISICCTQSLVVMFHRI
eukprot:436836-Hanusia_phi.AAC.4